MPVAMPKQRRRGVPTSKGRWLFRHAGRLLPTVRHQHPPRDPEPPKPPSTPPPPRLAAHLRTPRTDLSAGVEDSKANGLDAGGTPPPDQKRSIPNSGRIHTRLAQTACRTAASQEPLDPQPPSAPEAIRRNVRMPYPLAAGYAGFRLVCTSGPLLKSACGDLCAYSPSHFNLQHRGQVSLPRPHRWLSARPSLGRGYTSIAVPDTCVSLAGSKTGLTLILYFRNS